MNYGLDALGSTKASRLREEFIRWGGNLRGNGMWNALVIEPCGDGDVVATIIRSVSDDVAQFGQYRNVAIQILRWQRLIPTFIANSFWVVLESALIVRACGNENRKQCALPFG